MNVSSIIVTYNATRNNWLYKCLDSLQRSSIKVDVIVIDNASTDDTVDIIKEKYPSVSLIENQENKGFGGANNQGLKYALENGGEYFFLLNQDAWVEENTIEKLVAIAKENPQYGIVSPIHLNGNGNALDYNFSNYISPSHCNNFYSDFVLDRVQNKIYESGFICAAAWLLSKECLLKVGGFSPTFFHYGEDDNYVQRLQYKDLKIGVYPFSKIFHDRETRSQNPFNSDEKRQERQALINSSNPLILREIDSEINTFKRKKIKYLLLMNQKMYKQMRREITFRLKHRSIIKENFQKSVSTQKYIFLNYDEA